MLRYDDESVLHVMLDVETTSLHLDARITSLALVPFFLTFPSYEAPLAWVLTDYSAGSVLPVRDDPTTLAWRRDQDVDGIEDELVANGVERVTPREVVTQLWHHFHEWRSAFTHVFVWSWHTAFDVALVKRLCEAYNGQVPWHYREVRDAPSFIHARLLDPGRYKELAVEWMMQHCKAIGDNPDAYNLHDPVVDCYMQLRAVQMSVGVLAHDQYNIAMQPKLPPSFHAT